MLDKLIDVLLDVFKSMRFCVVVHSYEAGVVLRFGKFHRLLAPGFHWLIPAYIEVPLTVNVVPETMQVGPQSLTTKDGVSIIVSVIDTFEIEDVKIFLLEIEGAHQVIEDATFGQVAKVIRSLTWEELQAVDVGNEITKAVRAQAKKYGVRIISVQICDLTRSRSFRMMQSASAHHNTHAS